MNYPVYYNGKVLPENKLRIPLTDRAIWFGDGIYEAAIGKRNIIFKESEHIARLFRSAKVIGLEPKITESALSARLHAYINAVSPDGMFFLYFQCSRSSKGRIHAYPDGEDCNFLFTLKPYELPSPGKRLKLISTPDLRYFFCGIKSLNLLPSVLAAKEAEKAGCDEAVFIRDGAVTECSHSNISALKNGILYTHPTGNRILAGVGREQLIALCRKHGISVKEIPFGIDLLFDADEIFVTSSSRLAMCASELNGVKVGDGDSETASALILGMQSEFLSAIGTAN